MDALTHTLVAWSLARAGAERLGPYSTVVLLVAANISDLSLLLLFAGPAFYLEHSGWSHSLLGGLGLGAAVGFGFWQRGRRRGKTIRWRNLLVAGGLGALSSLLLDVTASFGTPLLWPFKNTRYALDWLAPRDIWLLAILLLGVALPALFSLISEEIGARRTRTGVRRGAWVALVACVLVVGGRANLHRSGVALLESRLINGRSPLRAGVFATPTNPFRWRAVVETAETYEVGEIMLRGASGPGEDFLTRRKPEPSPALDRALATPAARTYLARARFPWAEVIPASGGGWRIEVRDLTDVAGRGVLSRFVLQVELSQQLQVQKEEIRRVSNAD
jgi:membrane-bound metal-dependent hydrolase YbcI (DUF457 family)